MGDPWLSILLTLCHILHFGSHWLVLDYLIRRTMAVGDFHNSQHLHCVTHFHQCTLCWGRAGMFARSFTHHACCLHCICQLRVCAVPKQLNKHVLDISVYAHAGLTVLQLGRSFALPFSL
jgi:hypothetical protein